MPTVTEQAVSTIQVIQNFYKIAGEKGISIKDVEKAGGFSVGYLKRILNEGVEVKLSVNALAGICKLFGMSLDGVVYYHTKSGKLVPKAVSIFISQVIADTGSKMLNWQATEKNFIVDSAVQKFGYTNVKTKKAQGYFTMVDDKRTIYLYKVKYQRKVTDEVTASGDGYELFMSDEYDVYPVVSAMDEVTIELFNLLEDLEKGIKRQIEETNVNEHVKDMIFNYLAGRQDLR